jgi:phosphonoacetaldehyde hydrolase
MNIKGVVFDWAGTIVDFGSLAPMGAFVSLFGRHGVQISVAQARIPMGLPKLDHIRALGQIPEIAQAWQAAQGRPFLDSDAQALLAEFEPMSAQAALERSDFLPGFLDSLAWLQGKGLRVATTTGYTRRIMAPLIDKARSQGFVPDLVVCCDDVLRSRPDPMGMLACMQAMGLRDAPHTVVKFDDTAPGLAEALRAGCWAVGVSASGNALGWSLEQWQQAAFDQQREAVGRAAAKLHEAGAHCVVPSVAELPQALEQIHMRLVQGERPD